MDRYSGVSMKQEIVDTVTGLRKQIRSTSDLEYVILLSDIARDLENIYNPFSVIVEEFNGNRTEFGTVEQAETFWNVVIRKGE